MSKTVLRTTTLSTAVLLIGLVAWLGYSAISSTAQEPAAPAANTPSKSAWTKPSKAELKKSLTPLQYKVTQEDGTERAFANEYWNNKKVGVYIDIVGGKPLFSSTDKFASGTGWPSFTKPIDSEEIVDVVDRSHGWVRTEVRSKTADSHLGHVFDDGPRELGGMRYCVNSAALRFVPAEDLEKEGLGEYKKLFDKAK